MKKATAVSVVLLALLGSAGLSFGQSFLDLTAVSNSAGTFTGSLNGIAVTVLSRRPTPAASGVIMS
jgi:hypothetical protein